VVHSIIYFNSLRSLYIFLESKISGTTFGRLKKFRLCNEGGRHCLPERIACMKTLPKKTQSLSQIARHQSVPESQMRFSGHQNAHFAYNNSQRQKVHCPLQHIKQSSASLDSHTCELVLLSSSPLTCNVWRRQNAVVQQHGTGRKSGEAVHH
jgi:hypothetical protein